MKKTLALVLALCMVFALSACGGTPTEVTDALTGIEASLDAIEAALGEEEAAPAPAPAEEETPDIEATLDSEIPDDFVAEDGIYELAFVTDVGQLKDKSFNQGTWEGVKAYAAANDLSYKYYQPANGDQATDDDRYDAMKAAVDGGAKVVVAAGFMQEAALKRTAIEFPETMFVFIDGYHLADDEDNTLTNVAPIAFKEEQSGYLAGYAIVAEGYTKLGFCGGGGGTNPACCRYGYGFVQGAQAAAAAKDVQVEINYSWQYGATFSASPDLQTMASGWYQNGTEVIFACGGSMFASIVAAAAENDAAVIGVDVDQSPESDTVVTSALKGLSAATEWAIAKFYDGEWDTIGGIPTSLGANDNSVGLPVGTWSLENYSVEEYEALMESIKSGELVVDDQAPTEGGIADIEFANVTVIYS